VAHEMGIVHRDLKPENVMVVRGKDDEGKETELVKVCDFGVAKLLPDRKGADGEDPQTETATGTLTATGMLIGTPEYMSPEQVNGLTLDARSDLYSLGIILYQLLTRCLPFEDKSPIKLAMRQLAEEPRKPSLLVPTVDARLEAICLKAMSKAPEDRFANAREMRSELRAVSGSKDSGVYAPRTPLPPLSARVVPRDGGPAIDEALLSKAVTVLASRPPQADTKNSTGVAMPPKEPMTVTEPSARRLKVREQRTWLALLAIAFAVALLVLFAR
jgi:serine/threonine protein kinase